MTGEMWSRFQGLGLAYWILTHVNEVTEKRFFKGKQHSDGDKKEVS